jgi:hypothetical protein
LLNSQQQDVTLDHLVEIRNQSAPEEAEQVPKVGTVTILKLAEVPGLTDAGVKVSEGLHWNGRQAATREAGMGGKQQHVKQEW